MRVFIFFLLGMIFLIFISCSSYNVTILIEQPTNEELDKKVILIKINKAEVFKGDLKATKVASSYENINCKINKEGYNQIEVFIDNEVFLFDFNLPKDKYIILSPTYNHKKIDVGILKKSEKFILH